MKITSFYFIVLCALSLTSCNEETPTQKPNILLICIDDLRPELKSFGANHIISPNIDKLAEAGISFQKHFVNAPSCGPSRYTLLTGQYGPAKNDALFLLAKEINNGNKTIKPSMPEWFKTKGYTTVSVGKVSHHPGGRGGNDWNDSTIIEMPNAWNKHLMPVTEWQHPRGTMHGLAKGEIRKNAAGMDVYQSVEGDDYLYPDGAITDEALNQLNELTIKKNTPFFLAVGIIKPHLPFGAPKKYYDNYDGVTFPEIEHPEKPEGRTTWHNSSEFMKYNNWDKDANTDSEFAYELRRHYAACVSYADAQVGKILDELKRTGADKNTIIILWGDHGWHLGEYGIWGKHSLFEEALHAPLIIYDPSRKNNGAKSKAIVETVDIFPTLCELVGIEIPNYAQGVALNDIIDNPNTKGHQAIAYQANATTIRTNTHRLTLHDDGYTELYSYSDQDDESINIADKNPELVEQLTSLLKTKKP
jgi:iduronate 2-sulfatase